MRYTPDRGDAQQEAYEARVARPTALQALESEAN